MSDLAAEPDGLQTATHSGARPGSDDNAIVARVRAGELPAFELLMRRYNQRLFRLARSVLRDDDEAEDVVQETYLRAYEALARFEGRAQFSTWLTRIAYHEALARLRRRQRAEVVDFSEHEDSVLHPLASDPTAEQSASANELAALLAQAVDRLPVDLRTAFTLRVVEGLDTNETAISLDLTPTNVKVRVHRARTMLRAYLEEQIGESLRDLYTFGGVRCNRIVQRVLSDLLTRPPGAVPPGAGETAS